MWGLPKCFEWGFLPPEIFRNCSFRSNTKGLQLILASATVHGGPGAHPAFFTMSTGSFPAIKRPGRGADYTRPSSAVVRGRVKLYLYSPTGPSRQFTGWNLPFTFTLFKSFNNTFTSYRFVRSARHDLLLCHSPAHQYKFSAVGWRHSSVRKSWCFGSFVALLEYNLRSICIPELTTAVLYWKHSFTQIFLSSLYKRRNRWNLTDYMSQRVTCSAMLSTD